MESSLENFSDQILIDKAYKRTGLSDFGDQSFRESLKMLLASYNNSMLNRLGRQSIEMNLINFLCNRLLIQEELKKYPEIKMENIERPLFIVSMARTGTTFLQRLLASDPENRSPLLWELIMPAPAPDFKTYQTDSRIAIVTKRYDEFNKSSPGFKSIHKINALLPDECLWFQKNDFKSIAFSTRAYIPGYLKWLDQQDMIPTYQYQRLQLQLLQFRYPTNRWVLKCSYHMYAVDALLSVFPDACIVQLLRDPFKTIPSFLSLKDAMYSPLNDDLDPKIFRNEFLESQKSMLDRYLTARSASNPSQFYDMQYNSFVKNPVDEVCKLYQYFGYAFTETFEKQMLQYLAQNPKNKYGKHIYSIEQFGLTKKMIYDIMGDYGRLFELVE